MDHGLALGLWKSERDGTTMDPFAAAHLGWQDYHQAKAECGATDDELKQCSGVVSNPYEIAERISRASGRPWRGPVLITPGNKHYSWRKAANVFGLGGEAFWNADLDSEGRLDVDALHGLIARARDEGRPVLAVVTVAGTTEAGEIDPVDRVCDLFDMLRDGTPPTTATRSNNTIDVKCDVWHHVDAAYVISF
jgi:glutamate/tyrosine decarboxylase-like PLP-dependent enzyme